MTDYRKIVFGKTDAREESAEYPDLLMNGYFPVDNISEQVLKTDKFIILGNKGSGKTALSEYLKLTSDANTIVDGPSLKSFPFKVLGRIVAGESEPVLKHKLAWRWLLLVIDGLDEILRVLFDCSAIGLASPSGEGGQFKYRNRHASCTQSDRFVIHQGLCKGLDIAL
ncbi:MAG: hypothetical protein IJ755_04995 [Bacteroidales bacterium]|nr:hypothetical protein [Bacteroidales bacterium]